MIPLYYDRDRDGLPRGWIRRMKQAIRSLGWRFNADRMVMDYVLEVLHPRRRRHLERHEPVVNGASLGELPPGGDVMNPEVQEALSNDIHQLGDVLGETIRRLAGQEAFDQVEEIRAAAKSLRADPSVEEARRLRDRLGQLELPKLRTLIRAFSIYFDLINLAEQQARVRALRLKAIQLGKTPMAESPELALRQLKERGIDASQMAMYLERALICPVFTAHPSEARRRTILAKLAAIARVLDRLGSSTLPPVDREEARAAITEEVETFWLTATIRKARPTVLDEVRQGLGMVEDRLFDVVPQVLPPVRGGAEAGLSLARVASAAASPVRHLDRRRSRRTPQRHPRRHGGGAPAPAGDGPEALPQAGR